jgi:pimeloyl-ACP methyl ester carboxylesterase
VEDDVSHPRPPKPDPDVEAAVVLPGVAVQERDMATFDNDGIQLSYQEGGARGRSALVFLHGLSDSSESWAEVTPEVMRDHRVLCLDFRGHGESGRAPGTYRLQDYASDVTALIEQVAGGATTLVGHSLGGLVAAHLAGARPALVRAVFLEDPPLFLGTAKRFRETVFATLFPILQAQIRGFQERALSVQETAKAIAKTFTETGSPPMTIGGLHAIATAWLRFDPAAFDPAIDGSLFEGFDPARPISCPAHVVRADPGLGPAFFERDEKPMREVAPGVTFTVVEGASHTIHHERPVMIARDLRSFLDRLGGG